MPVHQEMEKNMATNLFYNLDDSAAEIETGHCQRVSKQVRLAAQKKAERKARQKEEYRYGRIEAPVVKDSTAIVMM
jgi:hypothetical protein